MLGFLLEKEYETPALNERFKNLMLIYHVSRDENF